MKKMEGIFFTFITFVCTASNVSRLYGNDQIHRWFNRSKISSSDLHTTLVLLPKQLISFEILNCARGNTWYAMLRAQYRLIRFLCLALTANIHFRPILYPTDMIIAFNDTLAATVCRWYISNVRLSHLTELIQSPFR